MLLAELDRPQLMMLAGLVMLGWVLIRRSIGRRKQSHREGSDTERVLRGLRQPKETAVPLCDAPRDTQRWQVALFDLQRELKAELDTRISVVQTLIRQVDERIDKLQAASAALEKARDGEAEACGSVENSDPAAPESPHSGTEDRGYGHDRCRAVEALAREGMTSQEIAGRVGLPVGEVEILLGTAKR
jgi:hypothetical protein